MGEKTARELCERILQRNEGGSYLHTHTEGERLMARYVRAALDEPELLITTNTSQISNSEKKPLLTDEEIREKLDVIRRIQVGEIGWLCACPPERRGAIIALLHIYFRMSWEKANTVSFEASSQDELERWARDFYEKKRLEGKA